MTTDSQLILEQYSSLEEEFVKFLKYVPLEEKHYDVWSFELSNILLNIGSIIDSFFKNSLYSPTFDGINNIDSYRQAEKHNMEMYRDIYKSKYNIEKKRIYEIRNFSSIVPYKNWANNSSLDWWKSYTDIKHNRFKNKEKASLKSTLDALGGLFLALIIHFDTIPTLVDHDLIKSNNMAKPYFKSLLLEGEPIKEFGAMPYYAKSTLFGYVYELEDYTYTDEQCRMILSPSYPGYGF